MSYCLSYTDISSVDDDSTTELSSVNSSSVDNANANSTNATTVEAAKKHQRIALEEEIPQITKTKPDIYGQKHPIETPALLRYALKKMKIEIDKIPEKKKKNWLIAKAKSPPSIVGDDHLLMFLRSEVFHADRAAARLCKYWKFRIELFGDEKAFMDLTDYDVIADESEGDQGISVGVIRLLEGQDWLGRSILFGKLTRLDRKKYNVQQMVRATWYQIHVALSSVSTQQKGIMAICHCEVLRLDQFDRELAVALLKSAIGILPIRISAIHGLKLPGIVKLFVPVVKRLMGPMGKRVKIHSSDKILEGFAEYGIPTNVLPAEIGGAAVCDEKEFTRKRKALSRKAKTERQIAQGCSLICAGEF